MKKLIGAILLCFAIQVVAKTPVQSIYIQQSAQKGVSLAADKFETKLVFAEKKLPVYQPKFYKGKRRLKSTKTEQVSVAPDVLVFVLHQATEVFLRTSAFSISAKPDVNVSRGPPAC